MPTPTIIKGGNPKEKIRVNPGWVMVLMASEHTKIAISVFRKFGWKAKSLPPSIKEALDCLKRAEKILTESAHGPKKKRWE